MRDAKTVSAVAFLLVVQSLAFAADPVPGGDKGVTPAKSKWPTMPVAKPVMPMPPLAIFTVKEDEWFIIERDSPAIVLGSPDGMVEVHYIQNDKACPIKYKGKFAGGGGKNEERSVDSKFIIELKPLKSGRCEIIIVPHGVTKEADIERKTVDVEAGEGPQPPPDTKPPDTKPPVNAKYFFYIVRPDGPASPEFVRVMSLPEWDELRKLGTVKDATLTESMSIYKPADGQTVPYVVTLASKDGKSKVVSGPVALPTDGAGILKLRDGIPK